MVNRVHGPQLMHKRIISCALSVGLGVSYLEHLPGKINICLAKDEVNGGMMFAKTRE